MTTLSVTVDVGITELDGERINDSEKAIKLSGHPKRADEIVLQIANHTICVKAYHLQRAAAYLSTKDPT